MYSQLTFFSDGYLGPSDELYIHFPFTTLANGVIRVDRERGRFSFLTGSIAQNGSNSNYIDGPVTAYTPSFAFLIGHAGVFQPLAVNGSREEKPQFKTTRTIQSGYFGDTALKIVLKIC